jgi:hypothetical protein
MRTRTPARHRFALLVSALVVGGVLAGPAAGALVVERSGHTWDTVTAAGTARMGHTWDRVPATADYATP